MPRWARHITVNKNAVPNDPRSPFVTSGRPRIGTPGGDHARLSRRFVVAERGAAIRAAQLAEWHVAEWSPLDSRLQCAGHAWPNSSTHDGCEKIPTTLDRARRRSAARFGESARERPRRHPRLLAVARQSVRAAAVSAVAASASSWCAAAKNIAQRLGVERACICTRPARKASIGSSAGRMSRRCRCVASARPS
jgi:hypothetical protein